MRPLLASLAAATLLFLTPPAHAELKSKGSRKKRTLVREQFPDDQAKRYDVFAAKCTKCHEMKRPIIALEKGITPISNGAFDEAGIKKYVVKMMRKENSGIAKDDAKEIIVFLQFAREQFAREQFAREQFARGQFARGQFARGQFARGQFARGQFARGLAKQ